MPEPFNPPNQTPPRARNLPSNVLRVAPPVSIPMPSSIQSIKQAHMNLGTFSPVHQDGCFEFDRVIKSGQVLKRTRKTKSWSPVYLALRPNLLSIYRDAAETKLRHQLLLSDLTAIARQRDPKRKQAHVFALFSPSRTFHLAGASDRDAQEWVELIRREARLDEEDEEMLLSSPNGGKEDGGLDEALVRDRGAAAVGGGGGYSSSEADLSAPPRLFVPKHGRGAIAAKTMPSSMQHLPQRSAHAEYSGPEAGSCSEEMSDAGLYNSALSLSLHDQQLSGGELTQRQQQQQKKVASIYGASKPVAMRRNVSEGGAVVEMFQDDERVVCQGWLHFLKSTRGMRQWKKAWVVLRPKNIAFYKNEEEYSATLILPFSSIIDAVDLDPISRRHPYCMQIIAEDRNYRFCAQNEDALARWLGALKSLLAKRKEASLLKSGSPK